METSFKKTRTISRLFPHLKNRNDASKLKIDDDSLHYISIREFADKISDIIKRQLETIKLNDTDAIITDATAGVGGDTLSFSKKFKFVNSIEIDKTRADYLENNLNIYECKNVKVYNGDCTKILETIENQDVIFIDPPWEPDGISYRKYTNLQLKIGNESIESFCNKLMDETKMKKIPKLIVFKLPNNYDIAYFHKNVPNRNIYYYNLNKMIILVVQTNLIS